MSGEEIIITKQYFELSQAELEQVSEYASNKIEFDDMKAFLLETQNSFNSQKLKTSPELDERILAHLHASPENQQVWYNSIFYFLFPKEKQFYKYPSFQFAMIGVLVLGVFGLINNTQLDQNSMAFEDVSKVVAPNVKQEYIEEVVSDDILGDLNETESEALNSVLYEVSDEEVMMMDESPVTFSLNTEMVNDKMVVSELEEEPYYNVPEEVLTTVIEKEEISMEEEMVGYFKVDNEGYVDSHVATEDTKEVTNKGVKRKDSKRDKLSKKINAPMAVSSSGTVTELDLEEDAVIDNGFTNNARQAATIESTPELLHLFFEVK